MRASSSGLGPVGDGVGGATGTASARLGLSRRPQPIMPTPARMAVVATVVRTVRIRRTHAYCRAEAAMCPSRRQKDRFSFGFTTRRDLVITMSERRCLDAGADNDAHGFVAHRPPRRPPPRPVGRRAG